MLDTHLAKPRLNVVRPQLRRQLLDEILVLGAVREKEFHEPD
jgi:hypothetical protein